MNPCEVNIDFKIRKKLPSQHFLSEKSDCRVMNYILHVV